MKKYILTQSKITNRLVRSINNLLMENEDLSLIPIKDNEDALLSLKRFNYTCSSFFSKECIR